MLRRLYDRILALAGSRYAGGWLAAIAFAEASCFPLPPDILLVPMVLARRERAWHLAAICTAASVIGGALGYLIGYALFDLLAAPILRAYHYQDAFAAFQETYRHWGLWVILVKGLTPIPYKIVTIASGAARFDFPLFMLASLATRGVRFFLVAGLLRLYGQPIQDFIERRLMLVTTATLAIIIAGFAALKYL